MIFYTLYRYRGSKDIECFYSVYETRRLYLQQLALWNTRERHSYVEVPTRCVKRVLGFSLPTAYRNRRWPFPWPKSIE